MKSLTVSTNFFAAFALLFALGQPAHAAIKSYQFQGTIDYTDPATTGFNSDLPLSDLLPQLAQGVSFQGTLSYQYPDVIANYPLAGSMGIVSNVETLQVGAIFDGLYTIARSAPAPNTNMYFDDVFQSGHFNFSLWQLGQPNPPLIPFDPTVSLELIGISGNFSPTPATLGDLDVTSPDLGDVFLQIRLRQDDLVPLNFFRISEFIEVPEPSSAALAGLASLITTMTWKRRRTRQG